MPKRKFHPIDVHVGTRLRVRRVIAGLTQTELAHAMGITFQQLQKYETGQNRVSASRLWEAAQVLDVPIEYFFKEAGKEAGKEPVRREGERHELELFKDYHRCDEESQRVIRKVAHMGARVPLPEAAE